VQQQTGVEEGHQTTASIHWPQGPHEQVRLGATTNWSRGGPSNDGFRPLAQRPPKKVRPKPLERNVTMKKKIKLKKNPYLAIISLWRSLKIYSSF
jgi:hypothetical protein